jgi:hypothetical protein
MADGTIKDINEMMVPVFFEGLFYDEKGPTDMDGVFELDDKAWIMYEVKRKGTVMKNGQRILMERFTKDMHKAGKEAYAIFCEHEPGLKQIYLKDCVIKSYHYNENKDWTIPDHHCMVKEITDKIYEKVYGGTNEEKITSSKRREGDRLE